MAPPDAKPNVTQLVAEQFDTVFGLAKGWAVRLCCADHEDVASKATRRLAPTLVVSGEPLSAPEFEKACAGVRVTVERLAVDEVRKQKSQTRRRKRRCELGLEIGELDPTLGPLDALIAREESQERKARIAHVFALVATLPDPYREVLERVFRHGQSGVEVARDMNEKPANVRTWLKRGLARLRKLA